VARVVGSVRDHRDFLTAGGTFGHGLVPVMEDGIVDARRHRNDEKRCTPHADPSANARTGAEYATQIVRKI
jgi:hypothetical protein